MANLNINLLPGATAEDTKTAKLKNVLTQVLTFGAVGFVVVALVFSAILLYFSLQLKNVDQEKLAAETVVKNLQDTEQKIFFIQDRITKIKTIQAADTLKAELAGFNIILDTLPPGSILREADINLNSIDTVIEIADPQNLTAFLGQIVTKDFKRINLKDFNYNPQSGYLVTLIYYVE